MINALVIDLDDTLCMTEEICFELENSVLSQLGRVPMDRKVHLKTWGMPLFEVIETRSPGVDVEAFRGLYRNLITDFIASKKLDSISEDNYKALDSLINLNKKVMILTSRSHDELSHLLEPDHRLASKIKAFYYLDNMKFHKPDPRAFDSLLYDFKLQPQQCAYIGDSVSDAVAAKKAGLYFIASLESGLRERSDFNGQEVDIFIDRFKDVVEAVQILDNRES